MRRTLLRPFTIYIALILTVSFFIIHQSIVLADCNSCTKNDCCGSVCSGSAYCKVYGTDCSCITPTSTPKPGGDPTNTPRPTTPPGQPTNTPPPGATSPPPAATATPNPECVPNPGSITYFDCNSPSDCPDGGGSNKTCENRRFAKYLIYGVLTFMSDMDRIRNDPTAPAPRSLNTSRPLATPRT